tara:strand:- start:555 stop:1085 length:531 start_codon:yes stop_codon:yes gene_type:complete
MSKIDLLLDEENELTFQINIEGNTPGSAKCRLMLENKGMNLLFEANSHQKGEISVILPPLAHVLKEGEYDMKLEVVVDDKFFEPLTLTGNFEKNVRVTAEAVVRKQSRKQTNVSASILSEASPIRVKNSKTVVSKQEPVVPSKVKKQSLKENTKKRKKVISEKDILRLIESIKGNK